jgi:uncharacterized protein YhbP (UPF0306 family)
MSTSEYILDEKMDQRIRNFLHSSTNLTLATCINNLPNCASCFYAYNEELNMLVIKSSSETIHIQQALINPQVAGTILPDKLELTRIKGIQFSARLILPEGFMAEQSKKSYYKKFPFALAMSGELWTLQLTRIKMTDNTLGFGKKLIWENDLA